MSFLFFDLNEKDEKSSHRSVSEVLNSALERCRFSSRHDDLDPRVVDEQGRVLPVDLVVVLRDRVARTPDASWRNAKQVFT
jgi:hypothetical protein